MLNKGVERRPSGTAQGTAFMRAMANWEYKGNQFGPDHLAKLFLPPHLRIISRLAAKGSRIKKKIPPGLYEYMIARTAFFDEVFTKAMKNGTRQIVILGAGYDTRAHRFSGMNQNTTIIELDISSTQNQKMKCLKKAKVTLPDKVKHAPIDFNKESAEDVLCKQGYDSSLSTLFLFEGVSYYLDPDSVSATLDLVGRNSNRDTVISFDYCASIPMQDVSKIYGVSELARSMASRHPNEKGRFALEEGKLESFLGDQGLKPLEHWNNQEIEAKWLTRKDGSSIGRITGWFRFVSASRTFAE